MFAERDPAIRFLVADEVGLGKTHVARGVIAQVIDHLQRTGDARQDIVYVCSNAAIARQNLRKLAPEGIEPLEEIERLTMLPLANLNRGDGSSDGCQPARDHTRNVAEGSVVARACSASAAWRMRSCAPAGARV